MKAETIDVQQSSRRILSSTIFRIGGRKLLAGGHILCKEDIRLLQSEGMGTILAETYSGSKPLCRRHSSRRLGEQCASIARATTPRHSVPGLSP